MSRPSVLDAARREQLMCGSAGQGELGKAANRGAPAADGHGEDGLATGASEIPGPQFSGKMKREVRQCRGWASI